MEMGGDRGGGKGVGTGGGKGVGTGGERGWRTRGGGGYIYYVVKGGGICETFFYLELNNCA